MNAHAFNAAMPEPTLSNVESEALLLCGLLTDNNKVDTVADLIAPDDFYEPAHQAIFHAILEATAAGKVASPITLSPRFDGDARFREIGGGAYLGQITGTFGIGHIVSDRELATEIADLAARRRLRTELEVIRENVFDHDVTIAEIVDQADAALVASVERRDIVHQPTGGEAVAEALARIEAIQRGESGLGAKTGIAEFDALTGGLEPGQVVIIGARPGMGKTALMCTAALGAAKRGAGVVIFSLEMESSELGMRMLSDTCCRREKALSYASLVNGTITGTDIDYAHKAQRFIAKLPINIVDKGGLTMSRLFMLARRHKRRMAARGIELKVIFIDYLQLIRPDRKGQSAYEMVSEISREMKILAKDLGVAVVALAQLNREVEKRDDKRPQLSDLRDSGQIEQDADIVMFLYREQYYLEKAKPADESKIPAWQESVDRVRNRLDLLMPKRRNGPSGNRWCWYFTEAQAVRGQDWS